MRKILTQNSKRGFTVIELLMAVGIVAAMMGGVATYVKLTSDTKRKLDTSLALAGIKENLMRTVNSGAAWTVMVAENPSLACLRAGSPGCADGAGGAIAIYDSSGKLLSGVQQNSGFDRTGEPCNTYNPAGSSGCLFRYNVRWTASCSFTPCLDPQIRVIGELEYSPTDPKLKNEVDLKRYSFSFFRAETVQNSLEAVCVSVGGHFNSGTNDCQLPWSNFTCPPGTVIRGLNSGNQPNCYYPSAVACAAGPAQILRAIDASGVASAENFGCVVKTCTEDRNPTGWKEEPPGLSFSDWTSSSAGDGGCDGADGGCGS